MQVWLKYTLLYVCVLNLYYNVYDLNIYVVIESKTYKIFDIIIAGFISM
jgi:hypothetical protein